jgi:hypothetical protein
MLKQETIQKIESLLKVKGLAEAIKAEGETDVVIDEKLSVFSEDELQTIKSNSYKDGKKAGVEMEVDSLKKELNLDFQGKTLKGFTDAYQKKILEDAKIEPETRVKELTKDLDLLRKENEKLSNSVSEKETEALRAKTDRELFKEVPETTLSASDLVDFARLKGYDFRLDETGKIVPYKNGEPVKDNLANPKAAKEVLSEFAKEMKLAKIEPDVPGGRGGGDNKPAAKAGSISELKKQFLEQGKSLQGDEFRQAYQAASKDNPEFKME